MNTTEQFFVDIRTGCMAIRNRLHPDYDSTYPGLHGYTSDVIEYVHGTKGLNGYELPIKDITRLNELCKYLNDQKPKFKVISDYPGSLFTIGDILYFKDFDIVSISNFGEIAPVLNEKGIRKFHNIFQEIIDIPEMYSEFLE